MKRLLFMVIVTVAVLASFARPEKEIDTSVNSTPVNKTKNTANHDNSAGDSTALYKKG